MQITIRREPKPRTWIMIKHYADDTMRVICHWHHKPSLAEINAMRHDDDPNKGSYFVVKTAKGDIHKEA